MGDLLRFLNEDKRDIRDCSISAAALGEMIRMIDQGTISGKMAKEIIEEMYRTGKTAPAIVEEKGMVQITDESALSGVIARILEANPNQLAQYRAGKDKLFGYFVGQVMKETKGKANPQVINDLLKKMLAG
jgi:aspartyl-tRNA(Asn)/glutamyl-tRNA(Gln) amidotransferase subunit B